MNSEIDPVKAYEMWDIENRFTYHPPIGTQLERYELLRGLGKEVAIVILQTCPSSRERSLALTKLEEVIMWANASIAKNEKLGEE